MIRFRYLLVLVVTVLLAAPLAAQPFGAWLVKGAPASPTYVQIPHDSAFDFTTGFTLEAWVAGTDGGGCSSIAGKGYSTNWWVGICGDQLRSYIRGSATQYTSGKIFSSDWTHIAVTYDGVTRKHYIDGELVGTRTTESGPMTPNTQPIRINSDVNWNFNFGSIDEVRIWNVARTREEIRANINVALNVAQPGLVAVYHLDGSPNDAVAGRNGTSVGANFLTSPVAVSCGSTTSSALCLSGSRFLVNAKWWVLADGSNGNGTVVPGSSSDSGNMWFFGPNNWELLVKVIDGCPVNNHKWVFAAGTTDQHFSLIVTDVKTGVVRRYFNYGGNAAPAITDTSAFATCP